MSSVCSVGHWSRLYFAEMNSNSGQAAALFEAWTVRAGCGGVSRALTGIASVFDEAGQSGRTMHGSLKVLNSLLLFKL